MAEQEKRPPVGGEEAGYLFEFLEDGVYLTVYPEAADGVLFELSDIRQILQENGVVEYDIVDLARIVREASGNPQKLADSYLTPEEMLAEAEKEQATLEESSDGSEGEGMGDEETPAGIVVEISRDRMKATVRYDTKQGQKLPSVEDVVAALAEKQVVYGFDMKAITAGVKSLSPFIAAEGLPPVHGENAKIERKFNLGVKGRPKVNKYDRVDYKDLNLFVLTKKGEVLAERIPQTEGTPGKDVLGHEIAARRGRPIPMPVGKGTVVKEDDDNVLLAAIDGQIVDTERKISVDPHLLIKGSVGTGTGNIDFDGSVEIKGNVEAGYIVKATGDVEVHGLVSGGDVTGRNVFVTGGINGMNQGKVMAELDVRAAFVENAVVEAGNDVYISDVVLHSNVSAGKHVMVEDKRGQIIGGIVAAGEEIRAKSVGNVACVVTRLSVGVNPNLQKKYTEMCRDYKEGKKRLTQITQMLNTLSKIDVSKLPPQRIEQINALTRSQFPLAGKLKRQEEEIQAMSDELQDMKNGKVAVSDTIYPGVRVFINSVLKNIQSEIKYCTLAVREEEVEILQYE